MTFSDVIVTVGYLVILLVLAIGIASASERFVLWRRRRAIKKLMQADAEEQRAWRSTWGGEY